MKRNYGALALATSLLLCLAVLVGCGGSSGPRLIGITVAPTTASVAAGATQQFKATAGYSDGTTTDVTGSVTWASSNNSIATVTGGLATGVAAGTVTITASSAGGTGTAMLMVTAPTLVSVAVTAASGSVNVGATDQFTAKATYSDNSTKDVTSTVTWASSSTNIATISATGLATGVATGTTMITATLTGVTSAAVTLTVTPAPQLVSIAVTPANPSVANPGTQQFTATGTYTTGPTQNLTTQVTWASSKMLVATIAASGLATTVGPGTTMISATLGTVSGNTVLTVTGVPVPVALQVSPATDTVSVGSTVAYTAQELWSDGTLHTPSGTLTWSSGTTATATVGASTGIAMAVATGTTVITATEASPSITGTANLTVQAATARFAFNADMGITTTSGTFLSEWSVSAAGAFTAVASTATVNSPQQILVHPSGHFFYAVDSFSNLVLYDVNSTNGNVTNVANGIYGTSVGLGNSKAAIDPTGRFIYLVNYNASPGPAAGIYSFKIDQATGALTAIGTNPMTTFLTTALTSPTDIVIERTGTYAYVVDNGNKAIYAYSIAPATGALTAFPANGSVATGTGPFYGVIDPTNAHLYVSNSGDNTISEYSITAGTGVLSQVGSATAVVGTATGSAIQGLAIDPSGKYLYATDDAATTTPSKVYGFVIGNNGVLGNQTPGSPYAVGTQPWGVTIDPTGTLVAVDNNADATISLFTLNPADGSLTNNAANATVHCGQNPFFLTFYSALAGQ